MFRRLWPRSATSFPSSFCPTRLPGASRTDQTMTGDAAMDTTVTGLQAQARGSLAYRLATLEIGPEVDWVPEHLAVSAWYQHVPFAFWLTKCLSR
jgi:hypothetical protein